MPNNKVKSLLDDIEQGNSEPNTELKLFTEHSDIIEFGMFITGHPKEAVERMYYNWFTFENRRRNEALR
jgi:hypothetical protein